MPATHVDIVTKIVAASYQLVGFTFKAPSHKTYAFTFLVKSDLLFLEFGDLLDYVVS